MHVRRHTLRLIGAVLTVVWAVGGVLVLVGYRPGGPGDIVVGVSALLPASVAAAGIVWPPMASRRGERGDAARLSVALAWVGIVSALILVPSVAGLAGSLSAGPTRPLVPSAEAAYGFVLALAGTCSYSALGIARALLRERFEMRRGIVLGGAIALVLTLAGTAAFAGAALANNAALRAQSEGTRWGPVGRELTPPRCADALATGASAEVGLTATAGVDLTPAGRLSVVGVRTGDAERWTAAVEAHRLTQQLEYVRIPPRAWRRVDGGSWTPIEPAGATMLLDTTVAAALPGQLRATAEEVALEEVGGARARHCRVAVDGPAALRAFPALRWLVGEDPLESTDETLEVWRGEIDWWVFADGQLGIASVSIHGPTFGGDWPVQGFQATLEGRMTALDRGTAHPVDPPIP